MSRVDADLVAVRDLPPGVEEPPTGRFAGRQVAHVGPGRWQDDPMYSPAGGPSSAAAEWRIVPADAVDPGVFARQLAGWAVVEEVGERP